MNDVLRQKRTAKHTHHTGNSRAGQPECMQIHINTHNSKAIHTHARAPAACHPGAWAYTGWTAARCSDATRRTPLGTDPCILAERGPRPHLALHVAGLSSRPQCCQAPRWPESRAVASEQIQCLQCAPRECKWVCVPVYVCACVHVCACVRVCLHARLHECMSLLTEAGCSPAGSYRSSES